MFSRQPTTLIAGAIALLACTPACGGGDAPTSDAGSLDAGDAGNADAGTADAGSADAGAADGGATRRSPGCAGSGALYAAGMSTLGDLDHDGMTRTFRVHVPPGYDGRSALPVVLMLHGGGGSAEQFELSSSGMSPIADRENFIAVYPDGTGRIQTWNAGGCCGSAVTNDVDDVGFMGALLDHLEAELCVDERRVYSSGMSNGALMSHRLACELSERFAAIAPVAGTEMSPTCTPSRGVALMHIHGSDDGHVLFAGGLGCGPSGVAYTSVPATMERRRMLNGCEATTSRVLTEGDGTCEGYDGCEEDTVLCTIAGGGHSWPGGAPPAGLIACPSNGGQSTTFVASEVIWRFFAAHALP